MVTSTLTLLQSTMGSRMMPEKRLLEAHIKHGITALNIFDKCPKIGTAEIRSRALAKLQEDINVSFIFNSGAILWEKDNVHIREE